MGNGVRRLGASCVAAGVLLASAATATVQTKTVSGTGKGMAAMPMFDTTLGTLLSVYAEASYTSWLPYVGYVPPVGYDHAVSGVATLGNLSFAISGTSQVTPWSNTSGLFVVTANGSATWTDPSAFTPFTGTPGTSGNVLGYVMAGATAPGMAVTGNFVPSVNYRLTYTFDNSPAVPEPATWAMMVGGFVLMGLALRIARRNRAVVEPSEA